MFMYGVATCAELMSWNFSRQSDLFHCQNPFEENVLLAAASRNLYRLETSCPWQLKCFWPLWTVHTTFVWTLTADLCVSGSNRNNVPNCDLWLCIFVFMQLYPSIPSFLPLPVDIREIRELRLGKSSRDFERYPEEARKVDTSHCFIVLYGLEFRLRTLSLAGQCINMCPSLHFHHYCYCHHTALYSNRLYYGYSAVFKRLLMETLKNSIIVLCLLKDSFFLLHC